MRVVVRTLTNVKRDVDVQETDSVGVLKRRIVAELKAPLELQRIVFRGSLLENDDQSLKSCEIRDGNVVILYIARSEPPPPPEESAAAPDKETIETATSGKDARPLSPAEPVASDETLFNGNPDFLSYLAESLSAQRNAMRNGPENPEGSRPLMMEPDPVALQQLRDMGFPEGRSRRALLLNRMNTQRAMDWLLEHGGDPDIDQPLSSAEMERASRTISRFEPDPDALRTLTEMGFSEDAAIHALQVTGNDQEGACHLLLESAGWTPDRTVGDVIEQEKSSKGFVNRLVKSVLCLTKFKQLNRDAMIITIDGPAGAGKSTIAKTLAKKLNAQFLDTGATYRAVTLAILNDDSASFDDGEAMARVAANCNITLLPKEGKGTMVFLDGKDVSEEIRSRDVTANVRYPAAHPAVRNVLVDLQRSVAAKLGRVVTEGRDQGSVVFPGAIKKFYLDASVDVRAQRRLFELQDMNADGRMKEDVPSIDDLRAQISSRDNTDRSRKIGPLCVPENAIIVDSSNLSVEEVTNLLVSYCKELVE